MGPGARRNQTFYDEYWSGDFRPRQEIWRHWWQYAWDQALEWAGPLEDKRVLNLFAGHGEDARMLQQRGADVVALDFSAAGLAHLDASRSEPKPLCADAAALPVADRSFDLIFIVNGLCHTPKDKVLTECRRALAIDGKILLVEPLRYPHVALAARMLEPFFWRASQRFLSVGELERLAQPFGRTRHREFFLMSICSAMLRRLLPSSAAVRRLHAALVRADEPILRALPFLRRFCYLTVASLEA